MRLTHGMCAPSCSSCWPLARSACRARLGQYMYVSASHAPHSATCAPRPLPAGRDPTSTCTRASYELLLNRPFFRPQPSGGKARVTVRPLRRATLLARRRRPRTCDPAHRVGLDELLIRSACVGEIRCRPSPHSRSHQLPSSYPTVSRCLRQRFRSLLLQDRTDPYAIFVADGENRRQTRAQAERVDEGRRGGLRRLLRRAHWPSAFTGARRRRRWRVR
jgi:hypothetical protein